jgi:hypothetical protein
MDGVEYTFSNIIDKSTGKSYESIEKLAKDLGPSWQGHKLQCNDENEKDEIINSFKEKLVFRELQKPKTSVLLDDDPQLVKRGKLSIIDSTTQNPSCLPLVSRNPGLNPYHPLLTPKNSATRKIKAFPYILYETARDCTNQLENCRITIERSITISNSVSYSISDGKSNTLTNTFGNNTSTGSSSSSTKDVSKMIDISSSFTQTDSNGITSAMSIQDSLAKTNELQSGNSKTLGTSRDASSGTTTDINGQTNWNNEINKSTTNEERIDKTDSWGR